MTMKGNTEEKTQMGNKEEYLALACCSIVTNKGVTLNSV